jgi:hypothetical protein
MMNVGELIEWLKQQPAERRVMAYDYVRQDEWLDIDLHIRDVKPVEGRPLAKYGSGETIVSIE